MEVLDNLIIVSLKYTSTPSIVVTSHGNKFGWKLVVRIEFRFADEGYLLCCVIFFDFGYIKEFIPHCFIFSALLFHLSHINTWYKLYDSMKKYLHFLRRDVRSAKISHLHRSRLVGMARKMRYLLRLSILASDQNLERAHIDEFPTARRASML